MKFKSFVLVVIAMLGALDGTALAQEAFPTYPTEAPKKKADQAGVVVKTPPKKSEAPKKTEKAPKKPSDKPVVAQVPNDGKLPKPKLLEDPKPADIDLDADRPLPPTEEPAPSAPAPTVEGPAPPPPAPSPAPVATVAPAEPPAAPPPEPEKAKGEEKPGFLGQTYIMPSAQGGVIFGWSPKGKEPIQVGRTTSWAGLSGGVGEDSCHLNKKNGFAENFCLIFEGRINAYLDKDTVLMRDMFLGGRLHAGYFGMFLRLGAEEDVGETAWAFRPGSVVDPRVILRDTFGHPGMSPIVGLSIGKYALLRAEGNPQKKFWGARLDLHLPIKVNPWFDLNFDFDAGARDAADEMGKVAKAGFGTNAVFKLKFHGTTYDGKDATVDWGTLKPSVLAMCERQAELLKTEQVGKIQAPMHNACVGQAGLLWKGPQKGSVRWQEFGVYYSYGRYFPIEKGYGGFSTLHVEQRTWFEDAKVGVSPFAAFAYGQNLQALFKVPDLTSDSTKPYWVFEFGVRATFSSIFQWFDGNWGNW